MTIKLPDSFYEYLTQGALAAGGGLIGALVRNERGGWGRVLLGALAAGFVGLLVAHLCHFAGLSDDLSFVCVGVSGWLGAERTIRWIELILLKRLNLPQLPSSSGGTTDSHDSREKGGL